jgi:hypothetical protein
MGHAEDEQDRHRDDEEGVRRMLKALIVFASEQTSGADHASLFAKQLPIPVSRNGAPP